MPSGPATEELQTLKNVNLEGWPEVNVPLEVAMYFHDKVCKIFRGEQVVMHAALGSEIMQRIHS